MKNRYPLFLSAVVTALICCANAANAQSTTQPDGTNLQNLGWVPNEVLVRFADNLPIQFDERKKVGIMAIDTLLAKYDLQEIEQLFPYALHITPEAEGFTTVTGQYIKYPKLNNIYRLVIGDSAEHDIFELITDLEKLGEDYVLYAEKNVLFGATLAPANQPNDTLYTQQYNLAAIQADTVQAMLAADTTKTDTTQVISIIDTGVDKDHEDLKNKMWKNKAELNGLTGVDDDQNGFIDDKNGWDFVNNDNNPMDDNSHGTHVAGIAAAETNNQKGIAGVSPGAKIMGVKVLQSSGTGATSAIAQGIVYAANNGGTVLNMSFGSYSTSQTMYDALALAYSSSFLVAAAGNDALCIGPEICKGGYPGMPMFPASYSFVLGVESSYDLNGNLSSFSNYDQDGPLQSGYSSLLNYEVRAPGSNILSTLPPGNSTQNNRYAFKSGTSMATPAVAGAVALLQTFRPTYTNEKNFLQLIKTRKGLANDFGNIQLLDAITYVLPPDIDFISTEVADTLTGGDEDFRADAGETIELVATLKNMGGANDSIFASISLAPFEDKNVVTFIDSIAFFGAASEYAVVKNNLPSAGLHPFKLTIDSTVANAREIVFQIKFWTVSSGTVAYLDSAVFDVYVQNGIDFKAGFYPGVTVLYPNKSYLFSGNSIFDTLIVKPGVRVNVEEATLISAYVLRCIGKPDSLIYFDNVNGCWWYGLDDIDGYNKTNKSGEYSQSILRYSVFRNKEFLQSSSQAPRFYGLFEISNCQFYHMYFQIRPPYGGYTLVLKKTYTNGMKLYEKTFHYSAASGGGFSTYSSTQYAVIKQNVFIGTGSNISLDDKRPTSGNPYTLLKDGSRTISANGDTTINIVTYEIDSLSDVLSDNLIAFGYMGFPTDNPDLPFNNLTIINTKNYVGYPERGPQITAGGTNVNSTAMNFNDIYLGGKSVDFLSLATYDYFDGPTYKIANLSSINTWAPTNTHGFVVDVRINGISTHWMDNPYNTPSGTGIIGPGIQKFEVVFNRPMDTTRTPLLAFGVREPYTQNAVTDSAHWSPDSKTFIAYKNITALTQSDGINRLSVYNAFDNENFACPAENVRFEFRISSTGALSQDFVAIGDTGKIHLSWSVPLVSVPDYLGTNMYRIDSTNLSNPTYLYNKMQIDSLQTDTVVQAGKWYGYYYNIVQTDLTTLNPSDTVWARPWQGKPTVVTLAVSNKTQNSATLNGKANPNYLTTQVRFNWGTTTSYGTNTTL